MKAKFRITDEIGPSSVCLGQIVSPPLTPDNALVTFDYSGYYQDNVSTFPGRSRYASASYDKALQAWSIRSVYASDAKITNRLIVKKGITKAFPLFNVFQSRFPHRSSVANWDASTGTVYNLIALESEVRITDRDNITLKQDQFLYDYEFVPAYMLNSRLTDTNLFYVRVYANEAPNGVITKLHYSALRLDTKELAVEAGYADYLSLEPIFNLYNINYDFKEGVASSLLGYAYEGSYKDATGRDPNTVLSEDPDNGSRPVESYYSLMYDGVEDRYHAILSDPSREHKYNTYQRKPCPLIAIYYQGTTQTLVDPITLRYYNNVTTSTGIANGTVVLRIKYGQDAQGNDLEPKQITMTGKSTAQLAYEINKLGIAYRAFPLLPIESINAADVLLDDVYDYSGTNTAIQIVPTPEYRDYTLFDVSNDGGTIIRAKHYLTKYSIEPTIKATLPTSKSPLYPWNPRVKVGGFTGRGGKNIYYISPFSSQQWSTTYGYPYVDVQQEQVFFKERFLIQTERNGLLNDPRHIKLYNESGDYFTHMISGIDAQHGYVFLDQAVPTTDALFIDYSYRESMVDVLSLNLNPVKPFTAIPGELYQLKVLPYWSSSITTSVIPYSMFEVTKVDRLPSVLENDSGMILAVFSIVPKTSLSDYKIAQSAIFGGGIDMDIDEKLLRKKIPDFDFLSDKGTFEGLRYPSNCVIYTRVPSFFQGTTSVVLEDYKTAELINNKLRIFGAVKIPVGTVLTFDLPGITLQTIVRGFTSTHEALIDPVSVDILAGTKVLFDTAVEPLFTTSTILSALKKTATIETEFIVE